MAPVTSTSPTPSAKLSAAASTKPPLPKKKLCETPPLAAGKAANMDRVDKLVASGAGGPGSAITTPGKWTWVSLWAAWCEPCKEEIPRLRGWESKLSTTTTPLVVQFMSVDDDKKQALTFLESQPKEGLRASFWLPEGAARTSWLAQFRIKPEPQLPIQLLFDVKGQLRCMVEGAVEDSDFESVKALLTKG